ncbi:MAG: site-2 protease family protein [Oscillospiraceae bacterium]|nr:site-2 protease family protein [Oscillospiraceae bacterium]
MYIIIAIILFGILIAVHEFGHFITAKLCGIKVLEFAIGMGPLLWSKQGRETLYSLRLLPIGGYCAMEGEDEESDDPRSFSAQHPLKKALVLVAGAAMNFLFGLILIFTVFLFSAPQTMEITDFMEGCPYESLDGFHIGDDIYKIDGHRVYAVSDVSAYLSQGEIHDIIVRRDGKFVKLDDYEITLREYEESDGLRYGFYFQATADSFGDTLRYTWYCSMNFAQMIWMSLRDLVSGIYGVNDLSGVVGIVGVMNDVGQSSPTFFDAILNLLYFAAFIAVNLALMNLLPIPALDGGRIFFLIILWPIEKLLGHKIDPKYEGYIHSVGLALLMALMIFVMLNDVLRIVG